MYQPTALAPQPTRSAGSITVSWGLVQIPLSVYSGTEAVNVPRKEFVDGDPDRPAGRAVIDKRDGEIIDSQRVKKMAQASNEAWVPLEDDEVAACASPKGLAEVVAFVPLNSIFEYIPEDLAQVRPHQTKGVPDAGTVRSFSLFLEAMNRREVCALIKFSMRGSAKFALVTPDANMIYVKSADQIRQPLPLATVPVDEGHIDLALKLIDQVGQGAPVIKNDTAERVREYVEKKSIDGITATTPKVPVSPDTDLMALLNGSLS